MRETRIHPSRPNSGLIAIWEEKVKHVYSGRTCRTGLPIDLRGAVLAINDHGLLPEHEIVGVLRDAAATHENAMGSEAEVELHRSVAALNNRIIAGGNSVRRPQG